MSLSQSISKMKTRDEDELEGALLPVAVRVGDSSTTAVAAVPLAVFDYETAIAEEQDTKANNVGYAIPSEKRGAISDDSRSTVRLAEFKGIVEAEAEKEAIRKNNRQTFSKNYFFDAKFNAANERAKIRNAEGLEVHDIEERTNVGTFAAKKVSEKEGGNHLELRGGYHVGGYEVKEYDIGETYDTNEYEVQEYKSVYD